MCQFEVREAWLNVIDQQEQTLMFKSFDNEDALIIGLKIIDLAKRKYNGAVTVSIEIDNNVVFSYLMQGMVLEKKLWMHRKVNVCKLTGRSSLHACVQIQSRKVLPPWEGREDGFVACGGCWAVRTGDEAPYTYIAVSGLEHYLDHQIIVDALSDILNKKVESIKL